MRDRRLIRTALQGAAMAMLLVPVLGTSCVGPAVYVFRRYPLSSSPDSTVAVPPTVSIRGYSFSLPAPKRHWWSDEPPRPLCEGFQLYRIGRLPVGIDRDSLSTMPPFEFELLLNRSRTPALVVFYRYHLPLRHLDPSTPEGAVQAARIARQEAAMDEAAEDLARQLVASAGMAERSSASETERTQSWEAMQARCRAEVSQARSPS